MTRNVTVEAHVIMEYPKEREIVISPNYSFRLSASDEAQMVEVSVDGDPWQACRKTGSHYWFDWENYLSGRHEIAARAWLFSDQIEESAVRHVIVDLEHNVKKH